MGRAIGKQQPWDTEAERLRLVDRDWGLEPLGFLQAHPNRAGDLAGGQRHRDSDTAVHADDAAGAGCGHRVGITANAIYQRPALSRVMRYDFHPASARLRLNQTQPIFGTSTLDRARLASRTRNP